MADEIKNEDFSFPDHVKLSDEHARRLKMVAESIPNARQSLAALKRAGINVRELEEKLDWAETVSKELNESFT